MKFTRTRHGALVGVLALALAACSTATPETADSAGDQASVQFEDNNGAHTITTPLSSVVATDNRTFETLASWDIELSAAAVALMPSTISYTQDDSIIDLGNHSEPDLESVVAVQPDVIINGQRFTQYYDDFAKLVPDAVIVSLDPREGEPFDDELKRQTTILGEIFGKQAEAEQINADFDAAIERVNAAYNGDDSVMAVITSGGEIGYSAPSVGRTLGPVFDIFDFTAALDVAESSEDHQGDDISVEAIANSNPDWILVMDRDAAILADDPNYVQGSEVLENSEALSGVTAVQEDNLVYMPADTYTNEGIQTYTEFFNALADALEAKN
ncbi:siderophore ABC transporter substrate-binding protein [Salinibacterium sp. M195]|uniref:siderophore ABC transporter substrate-binding protein n=1 Tax=Salinibacterium sp. M195 TaxID=2583374 RepID=UPI001C627BD6|nr:ABC transporter substrate-binding protein [Salinibacterium sp. M195]QYH34900.1 iron ABC transporter substrate-binding protein [Salinibacterium sp. M195]